MFPIKSEDELTGRSIVVYLIIISNIILHASTISKVMYGAIPKVILSGNRIETLLTYQFLHADIGHLLFNLWFLWIFGKSIEIKLGKLKFMLVYLVSGIVSALFHMLFFYGSASPLIGASGAVSGIVGVYMVLLPKKYILTFIPSPYEPFIHIPAYFFAGLWFLIQFILGAFSIFETTDIAYWGHIGGFAFGYLVAKIFN